jgi:hypothetical protein
MVAEHRGLCITDEQRFRFASVMSHAADDAGTSSDPEFRSPLLPTSSGALGSHLVSSQAEAVFVEHAPITRWGWGVAPPTRATWASSRCRVVPRFASATPSLLRSLLQHRLSSATSVSNQIHRS